MDNLVLNSDTKGRLDTFKQETPQGILLIGPSGSGKKALAEAFAAELLDNDNLDQYPYVLMIGGDDSPLNIEAIRQLQNFFSLKVLSSRAVNRIAIIENAQNLSHEAQNALLKLLEEPPKGSILILTLDNDQNILPTIRSRLQSVVISKPTKSDLRIMFKNISDIQFEQFYSISNGLPGLLTTLASNEDHPLVEATRQARRILSSTAFQRMTMVDELAKDKELFINALGIMQQMAEISLVKAVDEASTRWQRVLKASYEASDQLNRNVQTKLVVLNLMLNL
jgi:DNA polymerase-3 subunit delta'